MNDLDIGVEHALMHWNKGCNCAEATLRGVCHAMKMDLDEQSLRMATPFGGGIGRSEELCGAVAGAILAIGAATGREYPEKDKQKCYKCAGEFHKKFVSEFGSSSCRVLNKGDFTSPEHAERCTRFVIGATTMAVQVLKNDA